MQETIEQRRRRKLAFKERQRRNNLAPGTGHSEIKRRT